MAGKSNIEWTEHTWNPIVGCSILTPGCTNCYAMKMASRIEAMPSSHYDGTTKKIKGNAVWTGKLALAPVSTLHEPLRRKKPTTYFVNSMGDLFHEDAPDEWIEVVFAIMAACPQHTFQILTKRAERMREFCADMPVDLSTHVLTIARRDKHGYPIAVPAKWPLPNVWLGVSTERQQEADERIPLLLQTPAAVRFISAEPLLGPIALGRWITSWEGRGGLIEYLDWVIVGGESGTNARPMHPDWARSLRDQCAAAGVSMFFKQWGEWAPHKVVAGGDLGGDVRAGRVTIVHPSARDCVEILRETGGKRQTEPGSLYMARVGKKAAGRLLDGKLHDGMPLLSSALAATQNKPAQVQP